jgi:hypothetical protein
MNVHAESPCRRIVHFAFLGWIAVSFASVAVAASGQPQTPDRFKGRSLASALVKLQDSGLKIIFSTELVRPDMIVSEEPRGRQGPEILDELLAPHGLRSSPGPSGALLVVRAPAPKTAPGEKAEKKSPHTPKEPEVLQVREHVDVRAGAPLSRQGLPADWKTDGRDRLLSSPEHTADPLLPVSRAAGVATTDGSGGLNVRGGSSRETKIVLDGLELYDPYHLKDRGGPISILDSQNVGEVGLLSGGFPAEYGGHMSAVVEMDTVAPSDRFEAGASVSSGEMRVAAGGVLRQRLRWLVSARQGDPSRLLEALGADPAYRPPFSDFFVKADQRLGDGTTLSLQVLGADDEVEKDDNDEALETIREPGTLRSLHSQRYAWVTLRRAFSSSLYAHTVLSFGRLTSDRQGSTARVTAVRDARSTRLFGVKQDWLHQSKAHLLKWGFDVKHLEAQYGYISVPTAEAPFAIASTPAGADVGVYVADRLRVSSNLNVEVGVRWDRQTYLPGGEGTLSPRVSAVYAVGSRAAVRLGWGYFYQSQRIHELQVEDRVAHFFPAERAEHRIVSYQHAFEGGILLQLSGYQKRMSELRPRFENILDPFSFFPEANRDRIRIAPEAARADGIELVVQRPLRGSTGWWAAYTLARAEDEIDGRWVPRQWDRRHALNVGFDWKPTRSWTVTAAGSHHSGWPATPVTVEDEIGPRNSLRSTPYHRLDARVSRSMSIRGSDLTASLTLTDAFDLGGVCCVADVDRLVTFGLAWRF